LARFFADENFPRPVVKALRLLGHDVLTTQELGIALVGSSDRAILKEAASQSRAVLTLDRKHFIRLHDEMHTHMGIVVCSAEPDFAALAARIHDVATQTSELRQQILRINRT
jgi:hypothetical protein